MNTLKSKTDGFYVIDAGGHFKQFSAAAREMFAAQGLDAGVLIGKHIFDEVFPQASGIPVGRAIQRTLVERLPTEAENFYEPWQRWYSVRNYPTPDGGVETFFQDITERKQAEEALRQSREQLADEVSALGRLHEASTRLWRSSDLRSGIGEMLDASIQLLGADMGNVQLLKPTEKVLEIVAQRGFKPDFLAFFREVSLADDCACGRSLRQGQRIVIKDVNTDVAYAPYRGVAAEAGYRAVQSTPLLSRDGKPLGMLSTHFRQPHQPSEQEFKRLDLFVRQASDFIEHQQAQDALRKSEAEVRRSAELLQFLVDRSPTGFYIVDADFRISHINASSQEQAFRNVNPAIGRGLDDAMRILWPEPLATEIIHIFRHTLATGEPYKSPGLVSSRADVGRVETYEWQLERMTMPDGRHAVVCYYYDTTPLRESEQALRKSQERFDIVRDGAQVGFWFCDLPFDKLIWDNRVKEHFWLAPDATVTIDTFYACMHPDDRERTRATIAASIANRIRYDIEYRTVSPADGREKWIRAIGRTFYDANGQAIRFDGVTLDITDKKRAEEELRTSREELAEANKQLTSSAQQLESLVQQRTVKLTETIGELEGFSYSITHDLRAPLRAINSFSNMLAEEYGAKLDGDGKRLIARIQQSVTRMDKLIQDVLQYSRVLRMDLKLEPVSAERLVHGMLDSYPNLQEPKALVRIEGELPEVLANEALLTQCFSNLLNNAVKFVPHGTKPSVTVSAMNGDSKVRFWIEDNGIGIEPQHLENIFGLFQRLSKDYEGTGVGLSIVHKAVERMGGTVGVESRAGKGSRFWFELKSANNNKETR